MSYKKPRVGSDSWWNLMIDKGVIKHRPGIGKCMFCGTTIKDKDSLCSDCPTER